MSESVHKAFRVLEELSSSGSALGLSALANRLGANKATLLRYLRSLLEIGAVERTEEGYQLGLTLVELARRVPARELVLGRIRPVLQRLQAEVNESVSVASLNGSRLRYVAVLRGARNLQMSARAGDELPLHCTASGKAVLSRMPEDAVCEMLSRTALTDYTAATVTNLRMILNQLSEVRRTGVAMDRGEYEEGLLCVAVPLNLAHLGFRGAVGISCPQRRTDETRLEELTHALLRTETEIKQTAVSRGLAASGCADEEEDPWN